jgi:hypothetical protein
MRISCTFGTKKIICPKPSLGCIVLALAVVIGVVYFFHEYSVWSETTKFTYYFRLENTPEILLVKKVQIQEGKITANYRLFDAFAELKYKAVVLYPDGKTLKGIGITIEDEVITLEDKVLPDRPWMIDSLQQEGNKLHVFTKPQPPAIITRAFLVSAMSFFIMGVITAIGILGLGAIRARKTRDMASVNVK